MLKRIMDMMLDVFIVFLLGLLAPILIALFAAGMPFYSYLFGGVFTALIIGAIVYRAKARRHAAVTARS